MVSPVKSKGCMGDKPFVAGNKPRDQDHSALSYNATYLCIVFLATVRERWLAKTRIRMGVAGAVLSALFHLVKDLPLLLRRRSTRRERHHIVSSTSLGDAA